MCFVTDIMGSSLGALRTPEQKAFAVPVAKCIIKQVLLALRHLHNCCGYVHTDVKSNNILVKLPKISSQQIDHYLRVNATATSNHIPVRPPKISSLRLDNQRVITSESPQPFPFAFTKSQPLPNFGLSASLHNISVCLINYGEATLARKSKCAQEYQPPFIRAPEVILGYHWGTPIDIWSVGCLLFEIITDRHLFGQSACSPYSHLQRMM